METIVFFTNQDSVYRIAGNHELSWTPSDTDDDVAKNIVADDDGQRKFVIVFDGIQSHSLGKIINLVKEGDVYIIHHTYPAKAILENLFDQLKRAEITIKGLIHSQHEAGHLYENVSKIDTSNNSHDKVKLSHLFKEVKSHFLIKRKNSEPIQLWKSLSLLGIKILNGSVDEGGYANEIAKIDGITEGFSVFSEFENDLKKFWDSNHEKLYSIVKEANSNKPNE